MAISTLYWHLVVQNAYFILLLTYNSQEWQFHIATDIKWSRMSISSWSFISIYRNKRATLADVPPIWNCLMKNWQLHVSIPSMRTHLIWSTYKKIPVQWQIDRYIETNKQLDTIGRWTPPVNQAEMPAIPLHQLLDLFAHIDTKGRWTPQETARVQSELFAVQCHQWEPIRNSQLIRKYQCNGRSRDI